MNMTERYLCSYIFECLTGFQGTNPDYKSVIKNIRFIPNNNPILKGVVDIVQTSGEDPRDARAKQKVKEFVLESMKKPLTNEEIESLQECIDTREDEGFDTTFAEEVLGKIKRERR